MSATARVGAAMVAMGLWCLLAAVRYDGVSWFWYAFAIVNIAPGMVLLITPDRAVKPARSWRVRASTVALAVALASLVASFVTVLYTFWLAVRNGGSVVVDVNSIGEAGLEAVFLSVAVPCVPYLFWRVVVVIADSMAVEP